MKIIISTSVAALLISLSISCKKENIGVPASSVADNSSLQEILTDSKVAVGQTVAIGTQVWMTKNLDVTHYRNGDKIPQVKSTNVWAGLTTGAWCWYKKDSANGVVYGKMYNWYAVHDPRGLAPAGFHIPTDAEWTTLSIFLGSDAIAGGKMKSTGTIEAGTGLWHAPNEGATNSSGFTGLPGGYRDYFGQFHDIRVKGSWWSSSEYNRDFAYSRYLYTSDSYLYRSYYSKRGGEFVRCLKD